MCSNISPKSGMWFVPFTVRHKSNAGIVFTVSALTYVYIGPGDDSKAITDIVIKPNYIETDWFESAKWPSTKMSALIKLWYCTQNKVSKTAKRARLSGNVRPISLQQLQTSLWIFRHILKRTRKPGLKIGMKLKNITKLFTKDCVKAAQLLCVNSSPPSAAYMCQWTGSALVEIMACRLIGAKPLFQSMLKYCWLDHQEQTSVKFESKYKTFHSWKCIP